MSDYLKPKLYPLWRRECQLSIYEKAIEHLKELSIKNRFNTQEEFILLIDEIILASAIAFRDKNIETFKEILSGQSVHEYNDEVLLEFIEIYDDLVVKYGGKHRDLNLTESERINDT
jgi:hypothetical protein